MSPLKTKLYRLARLGWVFLITALAWPADAQQADNPQILRIGYQKYGTLVILKARGTLEERLAPLGVAVK